VESLHDFQFDSISTPLAEHKDVVEFTIKTLNKFSNGLEWTKHNCDQR
jgi:hypothetical protein